MARLPNTMVTKKRHTFSGCWTCRKRKVKCDEGKPSCLQCLKGHRVCGGYNADLVWVDPFDNKAYTPNGRRFLRTDLTWLGHKLLEPDDVDIILAQLDDISIADATSHAELPFQVFPATVAHKSECNPANGVPDQAPEPGSTADTLVPLQGLAPSLYPNMSRDDAFFFHHYSTHVAMLLMPYESKDNPWKYLYPAVAQENSFLLQAILSHAASNLANLHPSDQYFVLFARKKYANAVVGLRHALESGIQTGYPVLLGTILKLCMSEVFSGFPDVWEKHLNGGWKLFLDQQDTSPWMQSDFAWACTQSLCLLKIVAGTNTLSHSLLPDERKALWRVGMHNRDTDTAFGFTIGASPEILLAISDIGIISNEIRSGIPTSSLTDYINDIFQRITKARELAWSLQSIPSSAELMPIMAQQRQFIAATEIYFHRTIFDAPPSLVMPQVSEVFNNVCDFYDNAGGYLSLWPAFIAAVETVHPPDIARVNNWMEEALAKGIASRRTAKNIIEEVWRRRQDFSRTTQAEFGDVRVDWRVVMAEMNANVLLI